MEISCFCREIEMPFACKTIRLKRLNFNLHSILVSPIVATVNLEVSEIKLLRRQFVELAFCSEKEIYFN